MKRIVSVLIMIISISLVLTGCFEEEPSNNIQKEPEIDLKETFHGYTIKEWEDMVEEFFFEGEIYDMQLIADCKFDDSGKFTASVSSSDYKDVSIFSFIFDDETGYAKDVTSGLEINFINGKIVNLIKNQSELFSDNLCLGIAFISDENEEATIEKYFNGRIQYEVIEAVDFSIPTEYVDKFLIIPKDESVTFDICTCKITDEGKVEPDEVLKYDIDEPIILTYDDYESIIPHYGLRLKSNGYENFIAISFSGYDGSLNLSEHEAEVIDLTIY